MPTNESWQYQGRQQHGWFGTGTSPHDIHPVDAERPALSRSVGPLGHTPRPDPITPVYPLEYLLGIASGAALGRTLLSAAMRNLGWREPSARPDGSQPFPGTAARRGEPDRPNLQIHAGRQDKHIPGRNNYKPGRSVLLADPEELVQAFAGRGQQANHLPVGQPGSVERFDTGNRIIGLHKGREGTMTETTVGTIRYAKEGVHVVPARPRAQ